jgi:hypothetical protein
MTRTARLAILTDTAPDRTRAKVRRAARRQQMLTRKAGR